MINVYDVYVDVKWVRSDLRLQYNLKIKMCMRKTPRCSNELIANTYNVFMVLFIVLLYLNLTFITYNTKKISILFVRII